MIWALAIYLGIGWLWVIICANMPDSRQIIDSLSPWGRAYGVALITVGLPFLLFGMWRTERRKSRHARVERFA